MMELKMEVYSAKGLELLGVLEQYRSVIWEDKAFSAGSFSLEALLTKETLALLAPENIIWIEGRTAGIIEHIQEKSGKDGPYITVKGRLLTGILDRRILWGLYDLTGTPPSIIRELVKDCAVTPTRGDTEARKIPNLTLLDVPQTGESIRKQQTGGTLLEALEEIGEAYDTAFGVQFNPETPGMEFWARTGENRTVNQSKNEPVFYSTELDDVLSSEYSYDSTNYRNISLVAGEGEGGNRVMVTVQGNTGTGENPPTPPDPPTPPEPIKYTVSLTVDPEGGGTVTGGGTVEEGASVTVKASPENGFKFVAWEEVGASRLPSGYTKLEYIQSTGKQYIDTGVKPTSNTRIDVEFAMTATSKSLYCMGANDGTNFFRAFSQSGGSGVQIFYGTGSHTFAAPMTEKVLWSQIKNTGTVNGESFAFPQSEFTIDCNLFLFTDNTNGTPNTSRGGSQKLYSAKIYEDGLLVRNYIPCIDPSGAVGLYDLVNGQFYVNVGTDTFTAGPFAEGDAVVSENAEYTFTVTGNRALVAVFAAETGLPSSYTELQYVQLNTPCGIDTGVKFVGDRTRFVIDLEIPSDVSLYSYIAASLSYLISGNTNYRKFMLMLTAENRIDYVDRAGTNSQYITAACVGERLVIDFDYYSGKISVGTVQQALNRESYTVEDHIFIGVPLSTWRSTDYKLYSVQIYDGAEKIRDFVPCKDESGAPGLFDLVGRELYKNSFYGSLTAGPEA